MSSVAGSSTAGQKLRLNVVALIGEGTVGKLLVCIDEDAIVEDLASKVRAAVRKSNIEGHLLRLTNNKQALLPLEEIVGDVLRDNEEVLAVLTREPEDPAARQQLAGGLGAAMSFTHAPQPQLAEAQIGTGPMMQMQVGRKIVSHSDATPPPPGAAAPTADGVPGPVEIFEEDVQAVQPLRFDPDQGSGNDQRTVVLRPPRCDWGVEQLTPKLREYVVARFREMHEMPADPGRSYLTISLKPRERPGAVMSALPVHYSIARVDVIEFERLCGRKVQEVRQRLDYFRRCMEALGSLLDRGASREDYAPNMLPYSYKSGEEFDSLLGEVDEGTFGQVEGFRPLIIVDTAGAVGEHLVFVKAAVKRLLYSFLVAKSRFNVISFNAQGKAIAWEERLVPPVAQKLREVEAFLDGLQHARRGTDLLEGLRWALQTGEADCVYLISSGFGKAADVEYCRADVRSRNLRQLPVHVIGVECQAFAEVDLRRMAEENYGSFRHKRFNAKSGVDLMSTGRSTLQGLSRRRSGDERLTIGGQMDILEVMITEEEIHTTDWLEEQKCANQILLSSATQQPVPDHEQARYAAGSTVVNQLTRCAPPPLRELLGHTAGSSKMPRAGSVGPASSTPSRRGTTQPGQRARSHRPGSGKPAGGDSADLRRPSVQNPWNRPSGIVKVSQFAAGGSTRASTRTAPHGYPHAR
eukprot:TRINITY_DN62597_c0_g1_i1.p1 TRINITY_DN62597_c0_g1~~TRINITY_DN62597_c0_g1_i1.p1  ORF type:complete len:707 (-),score=114.61 TRINITY_DN62597_c0_g1_i1:108-2186(-)